MKHAKWLERVAAEQYVIQVQEGVDRERPESNSDVGKLWNRMHPPGILSQAYAAYGGMEDAEPEVEVDPAGETTPVPLIKLTDQ